MSHSTVNRNAPAMVKATAKMTPLSNEELRKTCPAIFSDKPIEGVTEKYGFISTGTLVDGLRDYGFVPVSATSYHRRSAGARLFAKHMVTFRPAGNVKDLLVGDVVPQVSLVNSHDRSSTFTAIGGLFRLLCTNGIMINNGTVVQPVKVRHTVNVVDAVAMYCTDLVAAMGDINGTIQEMAKFKLSPVQQGNFAQRVLEGLFNVPTVDSALLLQARRAEDNGDDLWHVFNRVQENVMRGGLAAHSTTNRAFITRPLNAIDVNVRFNTHAWDVAMETLGKLSPVEEATATSTPAKATPAVKTTKATATGWIEAVKAKDAATASA